MGDVVRGPIVPCEDWAAIIKTTRVDHTGEEIQLPEPITWAQIVPALAPADQTARVRATDLAEGPKRELLRDATKVLLPTEWPRSVPQAKVWVASVDDWADSCKGCAQRGLFTFIRPRMFSHAVERQCSTGCSGVPKKGQAVGGYQPFNFEAVLERDSFQCVPANHSSRHCGLAIPWSMVGIQVDDDERAIVWSESDMTAAFYCCLLEPLWYLFQAIDKLVPGDPLLQRLTLLL